MSGFNALKAAAFRSAKDNSYGLAICYGNSYDKVSITAPSMYFNNTYEDEWLEDEFVKEIVRRIDNSELNGHNVMSPVLGSISVMDISGGAKACILMYKTDRLICASRCGDNCIPVIEDIARRKRLTIHLNHWMLLSKEMYPIKVENSGNIITEEKELFFEYLRGKGSL